MGLLDKKFRANKNKNIMDSFKNAYEGIVYVITRERNMQVHLTVATLVIVFGVLFQISYAEWLICFALIALVISLEMINTSIEAVVDLITNKENPLAKVAKDASAGAVLVAAIISAFLGLIIFVPKFFALFI